MADLTRAEREENVIAEVRRRLPYLTTPGSAIRIAAVDPDALATPDGALFVVEGGLPTFVCRRGDGR